MKIPKGFREAKLTERNNIYSITIRNKHTGEIIENIRLIKKNKN